MEEFQNSSRKFQIGLLREHSKNEKIISTRYQPMNIVNGINLHKDLDKIFFDKNVDKSK